MEIADEDFIKFFALLLSDEKGKVIVPLNKVHTTSSKKPELCLSARLIIDRHPNVTGVRSAMTKAWNTEGALDFIEVGKNTFLIVFELLLDKWRICCAGPWSFNRDLLVLAEFKPNQPVEKWDFTFCDLWVQFHGLPLEYLTRSTARELAGRVGKPSDLDPNDPSKWTRFIRARVSIDITKPFIPSLTVELADGSCQEITVKFERMPRFCSFCGRAGHEFGECIHRDNLISKVRSDYPHHVQQTLINMLQPRFHNLAANPPSSFSRDESSSSSSPSSPEFTPAGRRRRNEITQRSERRVPSHLAAVLLTRDREMQSEKDGKGTCGSLASDSHRGGRPSGSGCSDLAHHGPIVHTSSSTITPGKKTKFTVNLLGPFGLWLKKTMVS